MYKTYYIYIMSSPNDTTLYIGVTNDLERRVKEHKRGEIPGFTQKYNCCKLVYFEEYSDIDQAIEREILVSLRSLEMTKRNARNDSKNNSIMTNDYGKQKL